MIVTGTEGQNLYPDPFNYPVSSFPQAVPAPDVDADDPDTLITVQYSWKWQPVLLAAVDQLLNPATWQGDHDQVITALNRAVGLKSILQIDIGGAPAPYWDDAEDVDDQAPAEIQPWYGEMVGLDFKEELGIWAITGFIAYSGQIGAAIAFKTFAPRFVLAWKRDGIAGAIRVFIDGVDSGLLDTNGDPDTILERDYIGDPALEEHDILMVLESVA